MARISTADSLHLVDQLAKLAKQHGGVGQATEKLKALKAVARPETVKIIDEIITSHAGTAAHRITAAKDELARALRYTHTTDWSQIGGGLQSSRGVQISETRKSAVSDAIFLEGKLSKGDDGYMKFKSGGKEYQVASPASDRIVKYPSEWRSINPTWVNGLLDERNVVLKGKLSSDGKTFAMEGFTVKPSGRHDWETFTPARVVSRLDYAANDYMTTHGVPADVQVVLATPDGAVYIKDRELAKHLEQLPKLAAMFPGEPTKENGKLVYEGVPRDLNIFLRIMNEAGASSFKADTAWSHFSQKPVNVPGDVAKKAKKVYEDANRNDPCVWALGTFHFGRTGEATSITASWISQAAENGEVMLRPAGM